MRTQVPVATRVATSDRSTVFPTDVSPKTSRLRLLVRQAQTSDAPDRIECEAEAFHIRLHKGFCELAQQNPDRIVVVNAERELNQVAADIRTAVTQRLMCPCN